MSRAEFEQIVASAPRENIVAFESIKSTNLAAGASETTQFFAPVGTIVKVIALYIAIPIAAGATTGNQTLWISYTVPAVDLAKGSAAFSDQLNLYCGVFTKDISSGAAIASQMPTDQASLSQVIGNLHFDATKALQIAINNGTNVAQTAARTIRIYGIQKLLG